MTLQRLQCHFAGGLAVLCGHVGTSCASKVWQARLGAS